MENLKHKVLRCLPLGATFNPAAKTLELTDSDWTALHLALINIDADHPGNDLADWLETNSDTLDGRIIVNFSDDRKRRPFSH
jgi:hypothetical protein